MNEIIFIKMSDNQDEIYLGHMNSILKPMIDSAKAELPKDPVNRF